MPHPSLLTNHVEGRNGRLKQVRNAYYPLCPEATKAIIATRETTKGETAEIKALRRVQGYVGRLMWLARTGRPDISHAVGILASVVGIWNNHCEHELHRLVGYLKSTTGHTLEFYAREQHPWTVKQLSDHLKTST